MDLAAIMDALAGATPTVATAGSAPTTKFAYPVATLVPPAVVVGYPTDIEYDATMARGSDKVTIPVWYVCGPGGDKAARAVVSAVIGGANEMKAAIESNATLKTKVQTARVTTATPDSIVIGTVTMIAVRFDVEVYT